MELLTDEDFKFAIESNQTVSALSADLIGSGPITKFTDTIVMLGGDYYIRSEFKFFIEKAILH